MSRADQRAVRNTDSGVGRRQRNKEEKLRRIRAAARALFVGKGYDEATMREIARLADVGLGTLFLYAADKRDLLFLAYYDEHEKILRAVIEFRSSSRSLLKNLVAYFGNLYEIFAAEPDFTRYILREVTFYSGGTQAARATAARRQIVKGIERLVADARIRGQLSCSEDDKTVARLFFGIFQAEVRLWLATPRPSAGPGLRQLERMLDIATRGLQRPAIR